MAKAIGVQLQIEAQRSARVFWERSPIDADVLPEIVRQAWREADVNVSVVMGGSLRTTCERLPLRIISSELGHGIISSSRYVSQNEVADCVMVDVRFVELEELPCC